MAARRAKFVRRPHICGPRRAGRVFFASYRPPQGTWHRLGKDKRWVAVANPEVRSALVPDAHGGNMDTPEMQAGVTCHLGVNVDGALLSLGTGHARQGEGETCGVAVECAMNTVVVVELLKGVATPWPRIESDTHIMSAGSARPLEDAFHISQLDLVQ
jgi:acetamidase/formamidase